VNRRVGELGRQQKEELIEVVIMAWKSIELSLVSRLMDSM
jgi:hypothetical protein